jgi:hypothetical protein
MFLLPSTNRLDSTKWFTRKEPANSQGCKKQSSSGDGVHLPQAPLFRFVVFWVAGRLLLRRFGGQSVGFAGLFEFGAHLTAVEQIFDLFVDLFQVL